MIVTRSALARALVVAPLWLLACESTTPRPGPAVERADAGAGAASAGGLEEQEQAPEPMPARLSLEDETPRPARPDIAVALPPSPELQLPDVPRRHPDGAFSVFGLRDDFDAQIAAGERGEDVELLAYVREIYVPPSCLGPRCAPAEHAHVWVADHEGGAGERTALRVAGFHFTIPEWERDRWRDQPEVVLERGKRYRFKGKFKRYMDLGFGDPRGVFEFVAYRVGDAWVYPRGAPWHPIVLALQAEADATLRVNAPAGAG